MCTVTYLPQQEGQFLLTSNRDEAPHRSPEQISTEQVAGQQLVFPRDEAAGGTWIVASDSGQVICILNGAFENHERKPPYRRSRGLMALDYFTYPDAQTFIREYTFEGMEAFTMLVFEQGKVLDLRWDQAKLHSDHLDPSQPHVWSSAPLYPAPIRRKREIWFEDWLEQQEGYSRDAILHWHRTAGEGDPWTDVLMNRADIVRTVSITSIARQPDQIDMRYHDLLRDQVKTAKISIQGE
jgi:uncharacterized protein with NRDE domain